MAQLLHIFFLSRESGFHTHTHKKTRFFGQEEKERRLCCSFSDRSNLTKNKEVVASFLGTTLIFLEILKAQAAKELSSGFQVIEWNNGQRMSKSYNVLPSFVHWTLFPHFQDCFLSECSFIGSLTSSIDKGPDTHIVYVRFYRSNPYSHGLVKLLAHL